MTFRKKKNNSNLGECILSVARGQNLSLKIHTHNYVYRLRVVALARLVCVSCSDCGDPLVIKPHLGHDPIQLISIFLDHHHERVVFDNRN